MKIKQFLATSALAASFAIGAPAFAQVSESGAGSADDNVTIEDILSDNTLSDNDQDNDNNGNSDVLDLLSNNGNGSDRDNTTGSNLDSVVNSNVITATQTLLAINNNQQLDEVVDLDGEDGSETAVGYNSGAAYARGNAFSAFAGISNNAWNTGINSNAQAATNIAAQGTVTFGSNGGGGDDGGAGGGD